MDLSIFSRADIIEVGDDAYYINNRGSFKN